MLVCDLTNVTVQLSTGNGSPVGVISVGVVDLYTQQLVRSTWEPRAPWCK